MPASSHGRIFEMRIALCVGLLLTLPAQAADRDWRDCAAIADAMQRLACYDAYAAALSARAETDSTAAFGLPARPAIETPDRIDAAVTGVRRKMHGQLVIWLDNGQVWEQADTRVSVKVDLDDRVSIEKGLLGSFKLQRSGYNASIKVRRLQ